MPARTVDLATHINESFERGGSPAFPVALRPIFYNSGENLQPVPDRLAVVREDTGQSLGLVSKRYVLVPHQRILDSVGDATAKLDVGSIPRGIYLDRNGARMRAVFKFPALTEAVVSGDDICPCLKIQNTYDGTSRITVHLGAFRFVCTNLAIGGGGVFAGGFMAVHTGEIPIDRVADELGSYLSRFTAIVAAYRSWNGQLLDRERFVHALAAFPKRPAEEIERAIPVGQDATVYRAYNAATWHATHRMRSARGAFDLLERINHTFQEHFPPGAAS